MVKARRNVPHVDGAITRCPQDQFGLSRSEHVGVIDAITTSDHRVHQRHPLAPRPVVIEDHLEAVEDLA
jgi:hypothetical protein